MSTTGDPTATNPAPPADTSMVGVPPVQSSPETSSPITSPTSTSQPGVLMTATMQPTPPPAPAPTTATSNVLTAAAISALNSTVPFLVLVGALHWSSDTVAAAYLMISNYATMVGLFIAELSRRK